MTGLERVLHKQRVARGACHKVMRVLIAEDEPIMLKMLMSLLKEWGFEPFPCSNGDTAWECLNRDSAPMIVLTDWRMPGIRGDALCRLIREELPKKPVYIILITGAQSGVESQILGLNAGADDYVTKPCNPPELLARIKAAERVLKLQEELRERVRQLEAAVAQVKQLQGLLPICTDCKSIRDDNSYWHQVENYIGARTDAAFTHSLCPHCMQNRIAGIEKAES
jgi:sigma-B regulation protein RsbU (phosphoserine phosphatase)